MRSWTPRGSGPRGGQPLAGDASYPGGTERLHPASGPSLIFMDQPPALETQPCPPDARRGRARAAPRLQRRLPRLAAGRVDAFVGLRAAHLAQPRPVRPEVVAAEPDAGFALLEDLGDDLYRGRDRRWGR